MNHVPQPQEKNLGYYFQSETCPGALETHVFSKFSWSVVCKRPVINVTLITLKIQTKKTRPIGYFPVVLMKLFELCTFQIDININCDVYFCSPELLMLHFFMKLQIIT